jgi:hypothetical protein
MPSDCAPMAVLLERHDQLDRDLYARVVFDGERV